MYQHLKNGNSFLSTSIILDNFKIGRMTNVIKKLGKLNIGYRLY